MSTKYRCPLCRNQVTVNVVLSVAPTCNNPKHKTNPKLMEAVK